MTNENTILNELLESLTIDGNIIDIFLISGVKISGIISSFDDECIVVSRDNNGFNQRPSETYVMINSVASITTK